MDYNSGGGGAVEQTMHMASHAHQYTTPQSATAPSFQYPQHMDSSRGMQSQHVMGHDASNLHPGHIHQQQYYTDPNASRQPMATAQSLATPATPSQASSPRFSHMSSPAQPRRSSYHSPPSSSFVPQDRELPSRDVSDEGFAETYEAFILYCNPSFPLSTDTEELRRVFRTPPKSDGKQFSIFTLFELIKKLESKEIKTWTELALELGVEKPVGPKQSSQKVQQYSVRLKRWMRALHIDAFFDYLMDKPHTYFRDIPPLNEPFPEARDGVAIEEDLAVRALDPKFRPKRGRRRADEQVDDAEPMSAIDPKRPHLDTSVSFHRPSDDYAMSAYPQSAVPMSAHPDSAYQDPWSNLTPASALPPRSAMSSASQQLRWRNETPSTPHPLSAVTPMSAPADAWENEPQSAVTPSSGKRKRRHGPAVSSAWPSTNTTANGKLRGRPPSNRTVRDGPFTTFPANPNKKEGPMIELNANRSNRTKRENSSDATASQGATESPKPQHTFLTPQLPTPVSASSTHPMLPARTMGVATNQRPERLQLTVPQHVGGPVHLVTPTVLVNGQLNTHQPHPQQPVSATLQTPNVSTASTARTGTSFFGAPAEGTNNTEFDDDTGPMTGVGAAGGFLTPKLSPRAERQRGNAASGTEDLKKALVHSLLRADVEGRRKRLRGTEAKDLADAVLKMMNASQVGMPGQAGDLHRFLCASWLGLSSAFSGGASPSSPSTGNKKIIVHRFRIGSDGYDSPLEDEDSLNEGEEVRETFDVEWMQQFGGLNGKFSIEGISLGTAEPDDEDEDMESDEGWRDKYLKAEEKLEALRERVLGALI